MATKSEKYKVLYQSRGVKVVFKPAGVLSTDISPLICHRLDRDTSGCLIIAKNQETKEKIQAQFKKRQVVKKYQAVVIGKIDQNKQVVEGWLERDPKKSNLQRLDKTFLKEGDQYSDVEYMGKKKKRYSKTIIRLVKQEKRRIFKKKSRKEFNYLSLVEAELITGRKHQIRVHLKTIGHPIIGDSLYQTKISRKASQELKVDNLLLQAISIKFSDPSTEKEVEVQTDLEERFNI